MTAGVRTPNLPTGNLTEVLGHRDAGGGRLTTARMPLALFVSLIRDMASADPSGVAGLLDQIASLRNDLTTETGGRNADITDVRDAIRANIADVRASIAAGLQPKADLSWVNSLADLLRTKADDGRMSAFEARLAATALKADVDALAKDVASKTGAAVTDALSLEIARAEIASGIRPGDNPSAFTQALDGGDPALLPALGLPIVIADDGPVVVLSGQQGVAMRRMVRIEPGRLYQARTVYRRRNNPLDPSGDTVRFYVAWYDVGGNRLAGADVATIIIDTNNLSEADGRTIQLATIAASSGDAVQIVAPAGAAYAKAAVYSFGGQQATHLEVLDLDDVTEAQLPDAVSQGTINDVLALKSLDLGTRLSAAEQAIQNPKTVTFTTVAAATIGAIPASADTIQTLGYFAPADGGGARYRYSATPPAGGEFIANGSRAFVLAEAAPSIQQFGGADDGIVDIPPLLDRVRATYPSGDKIRLRFPYLSTGVYHLAEPADWTRINVDADDDVVISATILPPTILSVMRPVKFHFRDQNYSYIVSPQVLRKPPAERISVLRRSDVSLKRPRVIDPRTDLVHAYVANPNGDSWIGGVAPTSVDANQLQWQTAGTDAWYGSFIRAIPLEELSCFFPSGENYMRALIVRGSAGYQILYIQQDGTAKLRSKPVGSFYSEVVVSWQAKDRLPTYSGVFAQLTICVITQRRWTMRVNGMDVLNGVDSLGPIEWIGFGTYNTGNVIAPIYGWIRNRGGRMGGVQNQVLLAVGDSRTEPLAGSWPEQTRDILDGSLGIRCVVVDNRGIGGDASGQQLAIIDPTPWTPNTNVSLGDRRSNGDEVYQVATPGKTAASGGPTGTTGSITDGTAVWIHVAKAGLGAGTIAAVAVGTNDGQNGVPLGAVGIAGTFIDNLYRILTKLLTHGMRVVYVLPELWYERSAVQQAIGDARGQNSGNSGGVALYRLAAERLCNSLGVPVVDTLQLLGAVDPGLLAYDPADVDPILRDNIHGTAFQSRLKAQAIAEALAALLVPTPRRGMETEALSPSFLRSNWTFAGSGYVSAYQRDEDGVAWISVFLMAGDKTGTPVVLQLPTYIRPSVTVTIPVFQLGAATRDAGRLQIGSDGQCTLFLSDSTATGIAFSASFPTD